MSTSTNEQQQQPKLTLHRGWLDKGKHVWSPFVIKVEARLRFANVKYEIGAGSPRSAPNGKIPYMEIQNASQEATSASGNDSLKTIGDSTLIIKRLVERGVLPDLSLGINGKLDGATNANDLAIRALMEDKLYFYGVWEKWTQNYYPMRDRVLSNLPYPARVVVGLMIYRNVMKTLHGQGVSRYTAEEIALFTREIWEAVNDYLTISRSKLTGHDANERPFWILGNEHPTEADTTVFGFIVSVLVSTACPDSQKLVREFPVILDYVRRIQDVYFPDYEKWEE
ncbi:hypothetical protein AJ79_05825 [Helicocarpus griseus UAMH5409]|uniref:Thioredoxin-like fold domain-containing protein n=1 Tax=Helicocarpus griseus UAMH5409 TaxID=1447875 RepID=A0A2B7XJ59_9EURO|nr:hypothetical protein AJ79_05825 [Helicocarpus griseus UAMH5409]